MSGYPIRMAVLVDFSDGSQHEYQVRGPDAVDAPGGMVLWPAAVVSAAMREGITREQACSQALAAAQGKLSALREWAEGYQKASDLVEVSKPAVLHLAGEVLAILDAS